MWEALLAIADLAGGSWPARARKAAEALAAGRTADTTLGERLLADLRAVFGTEDRMHTEAILGRAAQDQPKRRGPTGSATRSIPATWPGCCKPYGVSSTDVKIGGVTKKGYQREQLHEPWTRYLPPERGGSATCATSATAQVSERGPGSG